VNLRGKVKGRVYQKKKGKKERRGKKEGEGVSFYKRGKFFLPNKNSQIINKERRGRLGRTNKKKERDFN